MNFGVLYCSLLIAISPPGFAKVSRLVIFQVEYLSALYRWREFTATPPDPLPGFTLQQRQELCDRVLNAEVFQYVPLTTPEVLPPPEKKYADLENCQRTIPTPEDPDPVILRYVEHPLPYTDLALKMFPCVLTADIKWYVAFALREDQLFLIEEKRYGRKLTRYLNMAGLIERTSHFKAEFWRPTDVQFWLGYIRNRLPPNISIFRVNRSFPRSMMLKQLQSVAGNGYVRLCGSVFEALSSPHSGLFSHNVGKSIIYVRNRYKNTKMSKIPYFRLRMDERTVNIANEIFVTCSIARYMEDGVTSEEFDFFLLAHPVKRFSAVFVFREEPGNSHELHLSAVVYSVAVLEDNDFDSSLISTSINTSESAGAGSSRPKK